MQHVERLDTGAVARVSDVPPQSNAKKALRFAVIAAVVVVALIAAGAAYIWFSGGNGQASAAVTAPSLELQPGDTRSLFSVEPGASEARFIINEMLLGEPKTVVGTTNEVAGEMLVDLDNPVNSVLGVIRINVRTLETDNEFRTRALRGQILQADRPEYEFATFTPTELVGLPESTTVGQAFTFQIVGNLNVHGVSREVTFDATVTPTSESQIEGTASAVVQYRDFGMSIPEAPGVADISDAVRLEIDFVAKTANDQQ
ncbi:YceI family protein [Kamptonema cortianum]|jgi:polyisoprenoid-binding protein YceI|nr:YceI family protein [Geitlerinema splendidum]MDK3159361.1 YceI family protein [Kamptonema cortianum]